MTIEAIEERARCLQVVMGLRKSIFDLSSARIGRTDFTPALEVLDVASEAILGGKEPQDALAQAVESLRITL
jgi:hypothetical protein